MKINGVEDIRYRGNTVDIRINVSFDPDKANRWELDDPLAIVTYNSHGNINIDNIELVDKGMKVHGYEFSYDEEKEIQEFLDTNKIKEKIKGNHH